MENRKIIFFVNLCCEKVTTIYCFVICCANNCYNERLKEYNYEFY